MRSWILMAVACCVASPALAATQYSGTASGFFDRTTGDSVDTWGGQGQALITLDRPGFNLQVNGDVAKISGSSTVWLADGDVFWRDHKGAIGASVSHASMDVGNLNAKLTSYGGFGEWFALKDLTLRVKGGGLSGDVSGGYAGAGAEYYVMSNFGISADYTYASVGGLHLSTAEMAAEVLLSQDFPLSLKIGYNTTSGGGETVNAFSIVLTYRFGSYGSLVDWDRNGPVSWNGGFSAI